MKAEVAAAEGRGKAEAEKAALRAALDTALAQAQAQQASLLLNIQRLETDAKDYKVSSSRLHHHMRRFCTVEHAMPLSTHDAIRRSCSVGIWCSLGGVSYAWRMIMTLDTPYHPTSDLTGWRFSITSFTGWCSVHPLCSSSMQKKSTLQV